MTNTLETLAERIERVTGPDRELDGIIDRLLNTRPSNGDYNEAENCLWQVDECSGLCVRGDGFARASFCAPSFTASLDAAMTLVPEGWTAWELRSRRRLTLYTASISRLIDGGNDEQVEQGTAATAALALCAAALRARAQKKDEPDV